MFFHFFICICILQLVHFVPDADATAPDFVAENSCCNLAWKPLIQLSNGKKAIPSSAIMFGKRSDGLKIYLVHRNEITSSGLYRHAQFGLITDEQAGSITYCTTLGSCATKTDWKDTYVLANPNDCEIGWMKRSKGRTIQSTMEKYFPSVRMTWDEDFFGKVSQSDKSKVDKVGVLLLHTQIFWCASVESGAFCSVNDGEIEMLYVDCAATLRKQLQAELYQIDYDADIQNDNENNPTVLAITEIINESDTDQKVNVMLKANMQSSIEMSHETKLRELTETKWGIHTSVNAGASGGFLFAKFNVGVSVETGYDSYSLKDKFASEGKISFDSKETEYEFNQEVLIKNRSRNKISINTHLIEGSQKYTAYYRIDPKVSKSLSADNILATFTRLGYSDIQFERVNGSLIFKSEGFMSVSAGYNTHVLIESYSLNPNSPQKLYSQSIDLKSKN